jgi:hypothetical protein
LEAGVVELNTRGRYAVTAMADLAKYGPDGALALSMIAERQQTSLAYLEQLFLKLRRADWSSARDGRAAASRAAGERDQRRRDHGRGRGTSGTTRCGGEAAKPSCRAALPDARTVGCAGRADRSLPESVTPWR